METLLAIVVAAAVIFFGALVSMGNERQRRAIDNLREQVILWAVQDLSIKRKSLTQTIKIENPQSWLNEIALKVCGYDFGIKIIEVYDEPPAVFCAPENGVEKMIFSPFSPSDIRRLKKTKGNRLGRFIGEHPLFSLPGDVKIHELTVLNAGTFFDMEVEQVWTEITGRNHNSKDRLWMYHYS
jgi:hypothetical protein